MLRLTPVESCWGTCNVSLQCLFLSFLSPPTTNTPPAPPSPPSSTPPPPPPRPPLPPPPPPPHEVQLVKDERFRIICSRSVIYLWNLGRSAEVTNHSSQPVHGKLSILDGWQLLGKLSKPFHTARNEELSTI
eukprot:TRINITY_DN1563_c0_g3_i2.p1 TRINITY_DN1563_c0_g3~~TRINITY_DN1563_c0_g3_i2.p1  ORF type:complete len:132 (+),score=4.54 TRINITY_DN1563_c0_g3_i2:89-484(+)